MSKTSNDGVESATNLVVLVPEADDTLAAANRLLLSDKRLTAPAHITLVYPFLPSDLVVAARADDGELFAGLSPVSFRLHVGWFGRSKSPARSPPPIESHRLQTPSSDNSATPVRPQGLAPPDSPC